MNVQITPLDWRIRNINQEFEDFIKNLHPKKVIIGLSFKKSLDFGAAGKKYTMVIRNIR